MEKFLIVASTKEFFNRTLCLYLIDFVLSLFIISGVVGEDLQWVNVAIFVVLVLVSVIWLAVAYSKTKKELF